MMTTDQQNMFNQALTKLI